MNNLTPMMQQYQNIKTKHQDAILMFRLGDFYEMFYEDAAIASRELEIVLTSRDGGNGQRVPMCGVPFHAAETYIARLVDKGYKVAICEQVEDPGAAKGLVRREVIRIVTPGTIVDLNMLEEKKNNYLVALVDGREGYGLAVTDVSTGEFRVTQVTGPEALNLVLNELTRLNPKECLLPESLYQDQVVTGNLRSLGTALSLQPGSANPQDAYLALSKHFQIDSLEGFGCEHLPLAVAAAGMLLRFLRETQKITLTHLNRVVTYNISSFMVLDPATRRNLELTETIRGQARKGSLLGVLDYTVTAMGGRLLRQWVEQPLLDCGQIRERLEANEELVKNLFLRNDLRKSLEGVYDLERLLGRVAYGHAHARDLLAMKQSLEVLPRVQELLSNVEVPLLRSLAERLDPLEDIVVLIASAVEDDPPLSIREGGIIKTGYHEEVDRLREAAANGKAWIARLENKEREETGIKSLKIGYNKVFGYYLEVTRPNLSLVPARYIRKQTLANAERYITPELKELENQVLGASERLMQLEYQLFVELREQIGEATPRIQQTAAVLAQLDVLAGLAECAVRNEYAKPVVDHGQRILIQGGRHPVVERTLPGHWFVPNDTYLDEQEQRLMVITGPNMAGKSTYMRQVALIVLMAQLGSFIPAKKAEIGLVDRIFTRIGAADDLSTGQSTFMVEMLETAAILSQATSRSLIILDEVGRGTSTYDGMSIAQAVLEYIQNRVGAKTLFSTHYHELTGLEAELPGVKNYTVAVKEEGSDIVFLRRVIPGKADRSYGINVARLSGLPPEVLRRANTILASLEGTSREVAATTEGTSATQLSLFPEIDMTGQQVLEELKSLDIVSMTPLDAINRLYAMQRKLLS